TTRTDRQTAEHSLVDEPKLKRGAALYRHERKTYAQMPLVFRSRLSEAELAAHPERSQKRVTRIERKPPVLPAPTRTEDAAPDQPVAEISGSGEVTSDRSGMSDLDGRDVSSGDETLQTTPDDLHLGKFGHPRQSGVAG